MRSHSKRPLALLSLVPLLVMCLLTPTGCNDEFGAGDACRAYCDRIDECQPTDSVCGRFLECGNRTGVVGITAACDDAVLRYALCLESLSCSAYEDADVTVGGGECPAERSTYLEECGDFTR